MDKQYDIQLIAKVKESCDVLIIGGGPSGVAAGIAAARCGKKVIILEQTGQLGGMSTAAGVAIFMPIGNVTGFYKELCEKLVPNQMKDYNVKHFAPQFNPLLMRYLLLEMTQKEGINTYFHTRYVSPIIEGEEIIGVSAVTREGLKAFEGKIIIDATGDARVAIDTGADYISGREEDGLTQPVTLMFQMQNTGAPVPHVLPKGCYTYNSVDELPQGRILRWERNEAGTLLVNMTRVKGNGAVIDDINYFEYEALKQVFSVSDYLQRNGYENYVLSSIGSQTGVRESNQVVGEYTLSDKDIITAQKFEDVVAQTNYEIDIHSPDGGKSTKERKIDSYDIPYRCMIPKDKDKILVSGRAISATHMAMSSLRVMPTCFALGQAAGIAASIALDNDCKLADVNIHTLHDTLSKQGVEFY